MNRSFSVEINAKKWEGIKYVVSHLAPLRVFFYKLSQNKKNYIHVTLLWYSVIYWTLYAREFGKQRCSSPVIAIWSDEKSYLHLFFDELPFIATNSKVFSTSRRETVKDKENREKASGSITAHVGVRRSQDHFEGNWGMQSLQQDHPSGSIDHRLPAFETQQSLGNQDTANIPFSVCSFGSWVIRNLFIKTFFHWDGNPFGYHPLYNRGKELKRFVRAYM